MALHRSKQAATDETRGVREEREMELNFFIDRTGLIRSWLTDQLGVNSSNFIEWLDAGFPPVRAQQFEQLIRSNGKRLKAFQFSDDHAGDIKRLRTYYGIKIIFFAKALNIDNATLTAALRRQNGLRESELRTLQAAIQSSAREQMAFRLPAHFIKKAA